MQKMRKSFINLIVLLVVFFTSFSVAYANQNIALGKKYTLIPKPNNPNCAGPSDSTLTDGVCNKAEGFYTASTTVGWISATCTIIIDLESITPIGGLAFNTAGGSCGVEFPSSILVFVSDDGKTYSFVGNLTTLDKGKGPKVDAYNVYRYYTDNMKTHGRYIAIVVNTSGQYTVVDEIKVYRGENTFLKNNTTGKKMTQEELNRFAILYKENQLAGNCPLNEEEIVGQEYINSFYNGLSKEPLLEFVIGTSPCIATSDYPKLKKFIQDINNYRPDFFAIMGDFTTSGSDNEISSYLDIMEKFHVDVKYIPGIQEVQVNGKVSPQSLKRYHEFFGMDFYSFDVAGFHFIVLNGILINTSYGKEQETWLASDLVKSRNTKGIFIFLSGTGNGINAKNGNDILNSLKISNQSDLSKIRAIITSGTTASKENINGIDYIKVGVLNDKMKTIPGYMRMRIFADRTDIDFVQIIDTFLPPYTPIQKYNVNLPERLVLKGRNSFEPETRKSRQLRIENEFSPDQNAAEKIFPVEVNGLTRKINAKIYFNESTKEQTITLFMDGINSNDNVTVKIPGVYSRITAIDTETSTAIDLRIIRGVNETIIPDLTGGRKKLHFKVFTAPPDGKSLAKKTKLDFTTKMPVDNSERISWQAKWIWGESYDDRQMLTLKKEFNLPDEVDYAVINISVDDIYNNIKINGKTLGLLLSPLSGFRNMNIKDEGYYARTTVQGSANYKCVRQYDITKYLKKGENIILIQAVNISGVAGLIAESKIFLKNGTEILVKTDKSWEYTDKLESAGQLPDMKNVKEIGMPPVAPWGYLWGTPLRYPVDIKLLSAEFSKAIKTGDVLPVKLKLCVKPIEADNRIRLRLIDSKDHILEADSTVVLTGIPSSSWQTDQNLDIEAKIPISDYTIAGTYDLILDISGARVAGQSEYMLGQVKISNMEKKSKDLPPKSAFFSHYSMPNGNLHLREKTKYLGEAGVHLHEIWFPFAFFNMPDNDSLNKYLKELDNMVLNELRLDPDAYFIIIPFINAYPEWIQNNPNERYSYSLESPASILWLTEAENLLKIMITHFSSSQLYRDRLWGIILAALEGGEFHLPGCYDGKPERSPVMKKRFEEFLKQKYKTIDSLNVAWGSKFSDFDIDMPTVDDLKVEDFGIFREYKRSGKMIDYIDFLAFVNAYRQKRLISFTKKCVRDSFKRDIKVGIYAGYIYNWWDGLGTQLGGHLNDKEIFELPDIDMILNLTSYRYRFVGQTGNFGGVPLAAINRNKLFFNEVDLRTHIFTGAKSDTPPIENLEKCLGVLRREAVMAHSIGSRLQWGSQDVYGDCFMDTNILRDFTKYQKLYERTPAQNWFTTEIAFVIETEGMKRLVPTPKYFDMFKNLYEDQFYECNRIGAPFHILYLDDLLAMKEIPYKIIFFVNTSVLSEMQREMIETKLENNNRTLVWIYACGLYQDKDLSIMNIEKLTGMPIKANTEAKLFKIKLTNEGKGTFKTPEDIIIGRSSDSIAPRFYIDSIPPNIKVLGVFPDDNKCGFASRDFAKWKSIWCGTGPIPAAMLRALAENAGVPIYIRSGDGAYFGADYIALYAVNKGIKSVSLPDKADVYEYFYKRSVCKDKKEFNIYMPAYTTSLFFLNTGDIKQ